MAVILLQRGSGNGLWADTDLARVALCINGRSPDRMCRCRYHSGVLVKWKLVICGEGCCGVVVGLVDGGWAWGLLLFDIYVVMMRTCLLQLHLIQDYPCAFRMK
jgi:hypothetical protein